MAKTKKPIPKMNAVKKKKTHSLNKTISYVKNGNVFYKHVGTYSEVVGFGGLSADIPGNIDDGALKQKKLVIPGSKSASTIILKEVLKELLLVKPL